MPKYVPLVLALLLMTWPASASPDGAQMTPCFPEPKPNGAWVAAPTPSIGPLAEPNG